MNSGDGTTAEVIALRRDPAAEFDEFFDGQKRRLFTVAFGILRDQGHAEDAVQETMWKAWRAWGSVRDESAREAWVTRICVNQCFGSRRRKLRLVPFEDVGEAGGKVGDEAGMGPAVHNAAALARPADLDLDRALQRLPDRQRAALLLHYHFGYTVEQCGEIMGCRSGTVRSHLQRALATLRQELDHG